MPLSLKCCGAQYFSSSFYNNSVASFATDFFLMLFSPFEVKRYMWYKFKMYNFIIWPVYILQSDDYPSASSYTVRYQTVTPFPHFTLPQVPSVWSPHVVSASVNLFLFCWFCFIGCRDEWNHTLFLSFCCTHFTRWNAPDIHPHCHSWQDFARFYGCILFLCMCVRHVLVHLSVRECIGCLCILGSVNNAAVKVGVHVSFGVSVFVSFG